MNIKKLNDMKEKVESQGHMPYRTTNLYGQQENQEVSPFPAGDHKAARPDKFQ